MITLRAKNKEKKYEIKFYRLSICFQENFERDMRKRRILEFVFFFFFCSKMNKPRMKKLHIPYFPLNFFSRYHPLSDRIIRTRMDVYILYLI